MADRAVNRTGKDWDGDITKLCNAGEIWSPRVKDDAIRDIETGMNSYYVPWPDGVRTAIRSYPARVASIFAQTRTARRATI